ncbi:1,4-dihydroxy-2-naphthoate octaprenyltransferase [Mobilisporobacter senegalensis]|uniref:1,4-dihydroxy-2-naphthoate octaprenyltransferase n=1 Tax=Mobilisporobacter senegalensis TaxID=1329262 RepID=A0A3N1XG37_9FIRM|nr:UbiA family prenyltransferase [Mobilisporobacter senegalensis]ROR25679.1 1,4-dihydroxy-2-naphthoate octaprenyltransferase [Mobilisporobacter senegalensis]
MINRFLNYVEIKTKITSTFTALLTISFLLYKKQAIHWKLTLIFLMSMFLFDLTTTAINNYIDTKDNGQRLQFRRSTALIIIYILLGLSMALGLYLAYLTDIVILLIGGICFLCGIFYTYGPVPISRQPLGEILSGFFYGLLIPFIIMYINMPRGYFLLLDIKLETIALELNTLPFIRLILFGITPFCTTANIMLANNICDLEKDILVKRHTLPYYIGRKSLYLFAGLYYLTYIATVVMVIFGVLSPVTLLSLFTIFLVQKNISKFFKQQDKGSTFILAIKNFILIMGTNTIMIFISALIA